MNDTDATLIDVALILLATVGALLLQAALRWAGMI